MRSLSLQGLPDRRRQKVLVPDWPDPEGPAGNEVKTRTIYTGVTNGTERNQLIGGNYAPADSELPTGGNGYQNVGEVIEVGPDACELKIGDVLYMSAVHAEYAVMPYDGLLVKLPDSMDLTEAALLGISSVAMRTCCNAELSVGERVLIVGAGILGQVAAQVASGMGARATICDIDEGRLAIAREIGAAEAVLDVSGEQWNQKVGEAAFDVVIDFAGVPGMEDQLISALRPQGRMLFIAGRDKVTYTFNLGQGREVRIKQNSHFDREDLHNTCRLVARGHLKIGPLIRDVVPISEAKRIYDTLRDAPDRLMGTVFAW
ncbi:MAG: zinc-binding dehydrogenase [Gemmatimonadetes bacterium]|nr:zinc-binding dehydrogenase [Gemmatimonadota bacterium]MYK98165.1 zinc-binding dehydrogenase [Gemmatimonadota bacterium]